MNFKITTWEWLQMCCKPTYNPRRVRSKGAILLLVWNYLIMNVFGLLNRYIDNGYRFRTWLIVSGLVPPLAGWLADARIGRYKVIRCSIWIMWIATVLATTNSLMAEMIDVYVHHHIHTRALQVLLVIMAIGLGAYQANIIQFGLDQLQDASTTEITSFIAWYTWTTISACFTVEAVFTCLSEITKNFWICLNVTLTLILLICYNHWLIKEPAKVGPFTLAYKVLKYAVKNKHPRCRSAFTYCEDELPSRIDFGKSKYGGPFTTEQVEDVKTFLRLIPMAIAGGALAGALFTTNYFRDELMRLITSESTEACSSISVSLKECYIQSSTNHMTYYSAVLLIILHEIIFYPVFQRCLPQIESLQKILIGMLLQIARIIVLMTYVVIIRHTSKEQLKCLFKYSDHDHSTAQSITFSQYWIFIPDFLQALSTTMLQIGAAEFLSAQVPYFMKGLMIGMTYCFLFISSAIWFILSIPFTKRSLDIWGSGTISCGFWFSLIIAVTLIVICPFLIMLTMWYKKRRRQDVLPNEHIFAERYYSTDN